MIKLVGKTSIVVPGRMYFSVKPAAFRTDDSEDFVAGFGRAKRPVRKDVEFVDRVMVRIVPLDVVPERLIVGMRRVRIISLYLLVSKHSFPPS